MKVAGVDPGRRTGIALFSGGFLIEACERTSVEGVVKWLVASNPDVVVIEDFRLRPGQLPEVLKNDPTLHTVRVIGACIAWCLLEKKEFLLSPPFIGKIISDGVLRDMGLYRSSRHERGE